MVRKFEHLKTTYPGLPFWVVQFECWADFGTSKDSARQDQAPLSMLQSLAEYESFLEEAFFFTKALSP
jgi:hypothetical protein